MDIEKLLKSTIEGHLNSGDFKKNIENHIIEHIEYSVKEEIKRSFSWGDGSKLIKECMEKCLGGMGQENYNIPNYTDLIKQSILLTLDDALKSEALRRVSEEVKKEISQKYPDKISLEELIKDFIERNSCVEEWEDKDIDITFIIDPGSSLTFIYFDDFAGKERYNSKHKLAIDGLNGKIHSYKCTGGSYDARKGDSFSFGDSYSFGKYLYNLYLAGTIIECEGIKEIEDLELESMNYRD